ncbi:MAG: DNA-binding transcriptional regulator [Kiritimatiellae bacterium]|nr:DNA-binding transcriptional regulator [Kiritimatiellia bacterium]
MRKDGESKRIPKIAVLFSLALEGERNMCRGILDYARSHGPWRCHLVEGRPEEQLLNLKKEQFDGIIAAGGTRERNASFASVGAPFVLMEPRPEMLGPDGSSTFPFVTRDSRAIGALAASYYLKRGYKSFAYVGETSGWFWNAERRAGFEETLAKAGFKCAAYDRFTKRERRSWTVERPRMERFLLSLPRPTAVFAAMDGRARHVVNLCADIGLRVPEDIAVLGVDNDPLLCGSTVPPLSSIRTGGYRRGQTAAAMLDALMQGRPVEKRSVVQEPISVVTRGSTGYDAMSDLYVARAVKFMRDRIGNGEVIDVADIVREAHCSRRYLERHFRAGLGRSVHDELMQARLERVKTLLEETTLPIGEISAEVGYSRPSRLAAMFRRETGTTMRQWRQEHRETA